MQPRWIVPSKKPKDLEIGWKEICDNSLHLMTLTKKSQKRISDFSGLISTEMAAKLKHDLMYQSSFVYNDVRKSNITMYVHMYATLYITCVCT